MAIFTSPYPTTLDSDSTLGVAVSLASTTLSTDHTDSVTTFSLTDASLFDSNGGVIKVNNELIKYAGKSSNDLTGCTRAHGNSTAASHDSGDTVDLCIAAVYQNVLADAIIAIETKIGVDGSEKSLLVAGDTMEGNITLPDAFVFIREDSRTNIVDVIHTFRSTTTGTPVANIGIGVQYDAESANENPCPAGRTDFVLTDIDAGSEDSVFDILLRTAGAALGARYRFQSTGAFLYTFTGAPTAARTITLPDADLTLFLNKLDGTTAPTVNEDSGDGYAEGSVWLDVTNDKAYVCLDASVGSAVWPETTNQGKTLSDASPADVGTGAAAAGSGTDVSRDDHAHALNTATGEINGEGNLTITGGTYCFYPQIKRLGGTNVSAQIASALTSTSYVTNVFNSQTGGAGIYIQTRYVTSSGKDPWLFILWDNVAKNIVASSYAPDHPSYGQGADETIITHPFADYLNKSLPANLEIVLIDNAAIPTLLAKRTRNKGMLEVVNEEYEVDEAGIPAPYVSREIIEPDEWGDRTGEIIGGSSDKPLKRRMVDTLPTVIQYKKLKKKV